MPRKVTEKSAQAKKVDALKASHKQAKEKFAKSNHANDKAAMEKAAQVLKTETGILNAERFKKLANIRFKSAKKALEGLMNLANPRGYTFTKDQADTITGNIAGLSDDLKKAFQAALSGVAAKTKEVEKPLFE